MKRVSLCRSADCAQSPLPFSFAWHHAGVSRSESYPNIVLTDIRLGKSIPCSVQLLQMEGQKSATRSSGSERDLHFRENADFRIRISPLAPAPGHVRAAPPPFPTYSRGSAPARSRTPIPGIISFASATRGGESFGAPGHDRAVVPGAISRLSLQSGEGKLQARSRAGRFRAGRGNGRRACGRSTRRRGRARPAIHAPAVSTLERGAW